MGRAGKSGNLLFIKKRENFFSPISEVKRAKEKDQQKQEGNSHDGGGAFWVAKVMKL